MKLRCWPGALCQIINQEGFKAHLNGKTVVVTELSKRPWPHPCWHYAGPRLRTVMGEIIALADKELVPLTPPPVELTRLKCEIVAESISEASRRERATEATFG